MNCTLIMMDCQPSIGPIIFGGWWSSHQLDDNDQVNRKINTSSVANAHNGVSGATNFFAFVTENSRRKDMLDENGSFFV